MQRKNKGFTIIDVMILLAIIAVALSIVIPVVVDDNNKQQLKKGQLVKIILTGEHVQITYIWCNGYQCDVRRKNLEIKTFRLLELAPLEAVAKTDSANWEEE